MQMKTLPCMYCGSEVQLPMRSNTLRTWCSKECRIRYKDMKKQQQVEERIERVTECLECGEMTIPDTKKDRNFCSKSCYQTWLRKDRKAKGLCTRCGEPSLSGKTLCEKHNEANNEKTKQMYKQLDDDPKSKEKYKRPESLPCQQCGVEVKQPVIGREKSFCNATCKSAYKRNRYKENGICQRCGCRPIEEGKASCSICLNKDRNKKNPIRQCGECGKDYQPIKKHQRFCCAECKKAFHTNREYPIVSQTCIVCNNTFETRRSYEKTCSPECSEVNRANRVKENRPVADNEPRKCEGCGEVYEPGRSTQRYCSPDCKEAYRQRQREHAAKADQEAKRQYQAMLREHGLCRICPPRDLHYAVPGSKSCAYHSALGRYNRGVQLGTVEDEWKPKRTDYTLIPFDADNPLTEEEVEERMFEPEEGEIGFEETMRQIAMYYSQRTPDADFWGEVPTPRSLAEKGVSGREQAFLLTGTVPPGVLIRADGGIEVRKSRSKIARQQQASWT